MPEALRRGRYAVVALVLAATLSVLSGCGSSADPTDVQATRLASASSGRVSLTDGWVLAPQDDGGMADMPGMDHQAAPMVAAYGVFHNAASTADALTAVTAPAGARAQLHVTTEGTNAGTMKQVGSLTLPAGGKLVLAPAGSHVMIVGLRPVPKAGGTVTLTFVFRSGARVTATLPVISAENRPS